MSRALDSLRSSRKMELVNTSDHLSTSERERGRDLYYLKFNIFLLPLCSIGTLQFGSYNSVIVSSSLLC